MNDAIWWSDEYCRIYGLDPKQPTLNFVEHQKAYTREGSERLDALMKQAIETREPYEVDLELERPTSAARWIVAPGEAKRDANGKILEASRNGTEHHRTQTGGFSRILLDDYTDKLDDEGKRLLNVVRDNTRRIGQLIVRIPRNLDSDSTSNWTRIPRQTGQSERSDAGLKVFTLSIVRGSSF